MGAPEDMHTSSAYEQPAEVFQVEHADADATVPDEDSLVIMSDDAGQIFAPPARIAARFYRNKANTRRRSSATSSRRNSLSSAHSHASSHRRGSTGYQSHAIAQHLRRASILESRKARLADRAAHAEQVRLRAAVVKSAPRGSISQSEERALAAQLAKEKYLAKVAAACAEEVARAKKIAEEVKGRKREEERKQRLEMEERLAEADKRRAEYQRNLSNRRMRRASSVGKKLAVVDEDLDIDEEAGDEADEQPERPTLDPETAARRIQHFWRIGRNKIVVDDFSKLYLNATAAQNTSFEDMTALVAKANIIAGTKRMLQYLGLEGGEATAAAAGTRTFLSAYLILGHPVSVLSRNGTQEQDLIIKVKELVVRFETACGRLASWNGYAPNPCQLEGLSSAYTAYTSAFAAWRVQDSTVLVDGMVATFVELDAIWQTVKDDSRGEVLSDYREGIRDNQVTLLSRIRKLAGPDRADFLIKKAIRESRRARPKRRAAAEVRPRGIEPLSQPAVTSDLAEHGLEVAVPQEPPGSGELTRVFTSMPSNRVLTHELAIDKHYRLDDSTNAEMRDEIYRAVCNGMRKAFEGGEGAAWTVSAAGNIRKKLLQMLKPGQPMHNTITEALDLNSIAQQCRQGVFSYQGFYEFMANLLPKLCAPFRDEQIRTLTAELRTPSEDVSNMIDKLFRLLRTVDLLSLDYTNFMIQNSAACLIKESSGYEQRQFAKDIEAGVASLRNTKRWWRNASVNIVTEADRRDTEGVRLPADRPNDLQIYARGLVDLAIAQGELLDASVPETLQLDLERVLHIRARALRITVIGAVLLTAKNLLKRDVRSQWKTEANRLWEIFTLDLYTEETGQKALGMLESAHNMPAATKLHLQGTINRSISQAAAGRFSDPTLKLLFQRLKSHIFHRLTAASSAERVRAVSNASEALATVGLAEFTVHVAGIVEMLGRISEVDWKSHGIWYEQVANDVREAGNEEE